MSLIFDIPSISPTTGGGGGITPTGTLDINANGSYNVYNYAEANVSVLPNVTGLDITPSTSAQSFVATGGIDGYSPVNVSAVNASIDPNITSANIVNGCQILGVVGTVETHKYGTTINNFLGNIDANGVYQTPSEPFDFNLPALNVATNAFLYSFSYGSIRTFKASDLQSTGHGSFKNAFVSCKNLISVNFFSLQTAGVNSFERAFSYCDNLTSISFPSLQNAQVSSFTDSFNRCGNLISVNFYNLKDVWADSFNHAFYNCSNLTSVNFFGLQGARANSFNYAFNNCKNLQSISFPSLTNFGTTKTQFSNAFGGCPNLTEIHFNNSAQADIANLTGYSTKWGASNATIYFDL